MVCCFSFCVFLFDVFAAVSAFFAFPGPGVDEGPPFFAAYADVWDVHYLLLVVVVCVAGGSALGLFPGEAEFAVVGVAGFAGLHVVVA